MPARQEGAGALTLPLLTTNPVWRKTGALQEPPGPCAAVANNNGARIQAVGSPQSPSPTHADRPGSPTLAPCHFVVAAAPAPAVVIGVLGLTNNSIDKPDSLVPTRMSLLSGQRRRRALVRRLHSILGRRLRPAMASNVRRRQARYLRQERSPEQRWPADWRVAAI
jgi:hypothetical protein